MPLHVHFGAGDFHGLERPYDLEQRLAGKDEPEWGWNADIWWALNEDVLWAFIDEDGEHSHLTRMIDSMSEGSPVEFLR